MIIAMIQARLGSTRLPGKVGRLIRGKSMLARVIERTRQIAYVSEVVVATSEMEGDRWVLEESQRCGVRAFRGPIDDVLARYEGVAGGLHLASHDHIVRIMADCPLLDPTVSHHVIQLALTRRVDYASNLRDWPDGLDTEVFTRRALRDAYHLTGSPSDREGVTPWMRRNLFCLELPHDPPLRHVKWSVDTEDELRYVQELSEGVGEVFGWEDLLRVTPDQICWKCRAGYPHRRYPLGSIMQKSIDQPVVTVWDMHAPKSGLGILDPDPECAAPELSKRQAGLIQDETIDVLVPDATAPRNPSVFPGAPEACGDR